MGMNDDQIDRQLEVISNSQAYKQHGNGIVAQVIGLIVGMMYYESENELRSITMKNSHVWTKEKTPKGNPIKCRYCKNIILNTDQYCGTCSRNQSDGKSIFLADSDKTSTNN